MEFGDASWAMWDAGKNAKSNGSVSLLDYAIEHEEWELAGLCLLLGMVRAIEKMPREAVEAMLDELEGLEQEERSHRRRRGGRTRRGRRR
jgi:hypothetical protein